MSGKLRVYITVDTETSMGGAWRNPLYRPLPLERTVFGKLGTRYYGIPLIMDVLEQHNLRATFFTEVFCAYCVGDDEVARVFRCINERGHDAQLHLHPVYAFYRDYLVGGARREVDLIYRLDAHEQSRLIADGVTLFRQLSGKSPRAYRAGSYGASETTLHALRANGIEIDSSYNLAYIGSSCGFQTPALNAPVKLCGVTEYPVTVFRVGVSGYKPLEIPAVSVHEIMSTLRAMHHAAVPAAVLVLHSFSLIKNAGLRYNTYRPDGLVIRRLQELCAALATAKDEFESVVLGESDASDLAAMAPHPIPNLGWIRPGIRKLSQAVNRLPWV